jgi:hypothetical protein
VFPSSHPTASPQSDDSSDDLDSTGIAGGSSNDGSGAACASVLSRGQKAAQHQQQQNQCVNDTGVQDAFVVGTIYALSRRLLPGAPYTPGLADGVEAQQSRAESGGWMLDKCLRCGRELRMVVQWLPMGICGY